MSLSSSANVCPLTDCQSKGGGCACCPRRENRDASNPFSHRKAPEHTKTAKKMTVLVLRVVQNTLRYPTAENQAQSTRKSPASPSRIRPETKTMAAMMTATTMVFNGMPASDPPRVTITTSTPADPLEPSVSSASCDPAQLILDQSGLFWNTPP